MKEMAYPKTEVCDKCGAPVRKIWFRNNGKPYPVKVEPHPVEVIRVNGKDAGRGAEWYVSVDENWNGSWIKARAKDGLFYDGVSSEMMYRPHKYVCKGEAKK